MKAIGHQREAAVLVDIGEGYARVYEPESGTVHDALPLEPILARGYWTDDVPDEVAAEAVEAVESAGPGRDWASMPRPMGTWSDGRTAPTSSQRNGFKTEDQ